MGVSELERRYTTKRRMVLKIANGRKGKLRSPMKVCQNTDVERIYISTLSDPMLGYTHVAPDARELVAELDFVWTRSKACPSRF